MVLRERLVPRDAAVSPVVGMVLVLGISIVGIAAILYWGLPAIDEMKAEVEHKSAESQFLELDATIKELVAGTTEKTAKRWQPTLNRGSVVLVNESEGFVYEVIPYASTATSFIFTGLDDRDNHLTITLRDSDPGPDYSDGTIPGSTATIVVHRINGTTTAQTLIAASAGGTPLGSFPWTGGAPVQVYLFDESGVAQPIGNTTLRFRIFDGTVMQAEAWFVPTGRIDYTLPAGVGPKTVSQNNGAVLSGTGESRTLINAPPVPPAATTSGSTRHFARAVQMSGVASFGGSDRFDILVALESTFTLGTYDCADPARADCVKAVMLIPTGAYKDAWVAYLQNTERGYTFDLRTEGSVKYLDDREPWMGFTLLQSTVHLSR